METKLERITQLSKENPDMVFTSIGHLINMEMLKDCRSKVYEVAEQTGFRDIAHFSSTFKKIVGVSPSDYQKTAAD